MPAVVLGLLCLLGSPGDLLRAQPETIQVQNVAAGSAEFQEVGGTTTIRAADNTIINYGRFDVPSGSAVEFVQPSAASRVLNRIHSSVPSQIDGSLSANGIVYFFNSAGVMFGPGATVNVGQLFAGAASITDQDFLSGVDRFTTGAGAVVNEGRLSAEAVHLVGRQVANHGSIEAPEGYVTLAAGDEVYIGERDGRMLVHIGSLAGGSPDGSGEIGDGGGAPEGSSLADSPLSGAAFVTGDIYSVAVLNSGTIRARNITLRGGAGSEVRVDGALDASSAEVGATGGRVEVLGETVVVGDARIDASGDAGGGRVAIGGDFYGEGEAPPAAWTWLGPEASIHADATGEGDGGAVSVWADSVAVVHGEITARGGPLGGDGGFVETSGRHLEIDTVPDVSAPLGAGGTWLLDPEDITITDVEANITQAGAGDPGPVTFDPALADQPTTIDVDSINAALDAGSDVIIRTASGGTTTTGTITVDAPIAKSLDGGNADGSTLSLIADDSIAVHQSITSTAGELHLSFQALNDVAIDAALSTNGGDVAISAGGSVTQTAPITAAGLALLGDATFTLTSALNDVETLAAGISGGGLTLADQGGLTVGSVGATDGVQTGGGDVRITTTGGGLVVSDTPAASDLDAGGGQVALELAAGQTLAIAGSVGATGGIRYRADQMTLLGGSSAGGGTVLIEPATAGQAIDLGGADGGGTLGLTAAEIDTITAGLLRIGSTSAGSVSITDAIAPSGTATLSIVAGGQISELAGASIQATGLELRAATSIILEESNDIKVLAADVTNLGSPIRFRDVDGLDIGSVGETDGVRTAGGLIALTAVTGGITVGDTPAADDISATLFADVTLTAGGSDQELTVEGTIRAGNVVTLAADRMSLDGAVAGLGVSLSPVISGRLVAIGGLDGPGTLGLTAAELETITAGTVRIGSASSGDITVTAPVAFPGVDLTLRSGAGIDQTAGSTLVAQGLRLAAQGDVRLLEGNDVDRLAAAAGSLAFRDADGFVIGGVDGGQGVTAGGTVSLESGGAVTQTEAITASGLRLSGTGTYDLTSDANDVATIAADVTGGAGGITFVDADTLVVGSVAGVDGVRVEDGPVSLRAAAGGLTVEDTPRAADLDAGTGSVSLEVTEAGGLLQVDGNVTAGGGATYRADQLALSGTTTAAGATVLLAPVTSGREVDLGGDGGPGRLGISSAELDTVVAAAIQVGDADTGTVQVTAPVAPSGTGTLSITSSGGVLQDPDATITVGRLGVRAAAGVGLQEQNDVDELAVEVTEPEFGVGFTDTDGFVVGSVDGVSGVVTNDGAILFDAAGPVTQTERVVAAGISLAGTGSYELEHSENDVRVLAANIDGGRVALRTTGELAIGIVGFESGVGLGTGDLSLTAGGGISQTLPIEADGRVDLAAGSESDITLGHPSNDFGTLAISSAQNVTIVDQDEIQLDTSSISGTLSVFAGGSIRDVGPLAVSGDVFLTSADPAEAVTLDDAGSSFGLLVVRSVGGDGSLLAGDVTIRETADGMDVWVVETTGAVVLTTAPDASSTPLRDVTILNDLGVGEGRALGSLTIDGRHIVLHSFYRATGDILLNTSYGPDGRDLADATGATIYRTGQGGLGFITRGDFVMNRNEKLTVTEGSLLIQAEGEARLGDVSVRDNFVVVAESIVLLLREGGLVRTIPGRDVFSGIQIPTSDAFVQDAGLDFIAGGEIIFSTGAPLVFDGTGAAPRFADRDGIGDGVDFEIGGNETKVARPLQQGGGPSSDPALAGVDDFGADLPPLDLAIETIRLVDPTVATDKFGRPVASVGASSVALAGASTDLNEDPARAMAKLSVLATRATDTTESGPAGPTAEQFLDAVVRAVLDEVPPRIPPGGPRKKVGEEQLTYEAALDFLSGLEALLFEDGRSRHNVIKSSLRDAWLDYLRETPGGLDGDSTARGFEAFLRSRKDAYRIATETVGELAELFSRMEILGLIRSATERAEELIAERLAPQGLPLLEVVRTSQALPAAAPPEAAGE